MDLEMLIRGKEENVQGSVEPIGSTAGNNITITQFKIANSIYECSLPP